MSLVHHKSTAKMNKIKPSFKSDKEYCIGTYEKWSLKKVDSMDVSFHIVDGGREKIDESKEDRILIVTQGFATNLDTKEVIRDGVVIEIPAGTTFHFRGQLKYFLVSTK